MAVTAKPLSGPATGISEREDPREHLMLDPRPRGEMNAMVMESMHATSWHFWVVTALLVLVVAVCLLAAWGYHDRQRPGSLGGQPAVLLGHIPGQHRLLDRHQPRRHLRLGACCVCSRPSSAGPSPAPPS